MCNTLIRCVTISAENVTLLFVKSSLCNQDDRICRILRSIKIVNSLALTKKVFYR